MSEYQKPLPAPNPDTRPFWDYCRQHELRMQKCSRCGHIRFPPGMVCPKCHSLENAWVKLSGRGKVFSFVVFRYAYNKAFAQDIPYAAAAIELEEGPRMLSNIIGCQPNEVRIGMPVAVHFEDATDQFALPKFKLILATAPTQEVSGHLP